MLSGHSVETYEGNELTGNSSGSTHSRSLLLAVPLWTDLCLKNGMDVCKLISSLKKKVQEGMDYQTSLKILTCKEKATSTTLYLHYVIIVVSGLLTRCSLARPLRWWPRAGVRDAALSPDSRSDAHTDGHATQPAGGGGRQVGGVHSDGVAHVWPGCFVWASAPGTQVSRPHQCHGAFRQGCLCVVWSLSLNLWLTWDIRRVCPCVI